MQGQILEVGTAAGAGLILGDDGQRYQFSLAEWKVAAPPGVGMTVDYVASGSFARDIYPLPSIRSDPPAMGGTSLAPQGNASLIGVIAVVCLLVGFVVPVLPTIAALVIGLVGASSAKRTGDGTGLALNRIAWIGAAILLIAGVLLLAFAFKLLVLVGSQMFGPLLHVAPVQI